MYVCVYICMYKCGLDMNQFDLEIQTGLPTAEEVRFQKDKIQLVHKTEQCNAVRWSLKRFQKGVDDTWLRSWWLRMSLQVAIWPKIKYQETVSGSYGNELNSELSHIPRKIQNSPRIEKVFNAYILLHPWLQGSGELLQFSVCMHKASEGYSLNFLLLKLARNYKLRRQYLVLKGLYISR